MPTLLWKAYAAAVGAAPPSCHLSISLLAAIGQVESGSLRGRALDPDHRAVPAVLGPVLDGHSFAAIPDTDGGALDADMVWDRAVGPMQFIPSTWARWGRDGDGDGAALPQDIEDAAASAAAYLCAGGRDLATPEGLRAAILSYNRSKAYLALVLRWKQAFEATPSGTGSIPTVAAALPGHAVQGPVTAAAPATVVQQPALEPAAAEPAPTSQPTSQPNADPSAVPAAQTCAPQPGIPTAGTTVGPDGQALVEPTPPASNATEQPDPAPSMPAPGSPGACATPDQTPPTPTSGQLPVPTPGATPAPAP